MSNTYHDVDLEDSDHEFSPSPDRDNDEFVLTEDAADKQEIDFLNFLDSAAPPKVVIVHTTPCARKPLKVRPSPPVRGILVRSCRPKNGPLLILDADSEKKFVQGMLKSVQLVKQVKK
jgi:hypothetical protein